jgi:hypothetical protein
MNLNVKEKEINEKGEKETQTKYANMFKQFFLRAS